MKTLTYINAKPGWHKRFYRYCKHNIFDFEFYYTRKLPLFISFPRTGSHWLNNLMEVYFDRPRLRKGRTTLIDSARKDWLYFHEHDIFLRLKSKNVLYLYRDPVDTLFSLITYNLSAPLEQQSIRALIGISSCKQLPEKEVRLLATVYHHHLYYYLVDPGLAQASVRYEKLRSNDKNEFKCITNFFNFEYDPQRMAEVRARVTKKKLVEAGDKRGGDHGIRGDMLKEDYEKDRKQFKEQWSPLIREIVFTDELKPYFE